MKYMATSRADLEANKLVDTGTGRAAVLTAVAMQAEQVSYTANNLPEYIGVSKVGVGTGESGWAIAKLEYDGTKMVSKTWGSGSAAYDKIWNDRASYTYI